MSRLLLRSCRGSLRSGLAEGALGDSAAVLLSLVDFSVQAHTGKKDVALGLSIEQFYS